MYNGRYSACMYSLPMAEAHYLPQSHQPGSSQAHLSEEGSGTSQPIITMSSMNLCEVNSNMVTIATVYIDTGFSVD